MKDIFKVSSLLVFTLFIVMFFAVFAPSPTVKTQITNAVPVVNMNYEVQSLVKTYEIHECFDTGNTDSDVCCAY